MSSPRPASSSPRAELARTLTTDPAGCRSPTRSYTFAATPSVRRAQAAASPASPPPTITTRSSPMGLRHALAQLEVRFQQGLVALGQLARLGERHPGAVVEAVGGPLVGREADRVRVDRRVGVDLDAQRVGDDVERDDHRGL